MSDVTMIPVQSSNIAELGYDDEARELHVRFLTPGETGNQVPSDDVYTYPSVERALYDQLVRGDVPYNFSVGKEFDRCVKKVVDRKLVKKFHRPKTEE